jgi:hypothetical protein
MSRRNTVRSVLLPSCLLLSAMAGEALGQTYASGFLHTPMGGATLGPVQGRRLVVSNLGSSGQDGVSIACDNKTGGACDLDLAQLFATPGASVSARFRESPTIIRGRVSMTALAGNECAMAGDFPGATSVRWVVRDAAGIELASGVVNGPAASCRVSGPGAGQSSQWSVHAEYGFPPNWEAYKHWKARMRSLNHATRVSGLTASPIDGAGSVEFFPIICITSPCPGQWGGLSSIDLQARGLSSLTVSNAAGSKGIARSSSDQPPVDSKVADYYAVGTATLADFCDLPPPVACAPTERKLQVSNIGSSGLDGVEIDFTSGRSLHREGLVHRDLAARNVLLSCSAPISGGAGTPFGGEMVITAKGNGRKNYVGHVTLIKQRVRPNPATGNPMYSFDATGRGAAECTVRMVGSNGAIIGIVVGAPAMTFELSNCPANGSITYIGTCDADGCSVQTCSPTTVVRCSNGQVFDNVARLVCTPLNPTEPGDLIEQIQVTGASVPSVTVSSVQYDTPIFQGGVEIAPVGSASIADPDSTTDERRLVATNIGSSGQDGVEVKWRSSKGGRLTVDIGPMIGPSSSDRTLRTRYKGWDGTIKGRVDLTTTAAGLMRQSCDFSGSGITSVRVTARDSFGNIVGDVTYDGSTAQWGVAVTASNPAISPTMSLTVKPSGYEVKKAIRCRVAGGSMHLSLPDPATGTTIECDAAELEITSACCGTDVILGDLYSAVVTGSGLGNFAVTGAAMHTFDVPFTATGQAVIREECDDADACDAGRVSLTLSNTGTWGYGNALLALGQRQRGSEVTYRQSWGGGGNGASGLGESIWTLHNSSNGGQAVLLAVFEEQVPGARLIGFDATGVGSQTCDVVLLSASGQKLGSATVQPLVRIRKRPEILFQAWEDEITLRSDGIIYSFPGGTQRVTLPGQSEVPGVASMVVRPVHQQRDLCEVDTTQVACLTVNPVKFGGCILRPPTNARLSSIPVSPIGQAVTTVQADGSVHLSNMRLSGGDGASLLLDSQWGGTVWAEMTPLLSPPAAGQTIKIKHKGWDGLIYGNHRVARLPGGGPPRLGNDVDFSSVGATGIEWRLLDSGGNVVDSGTVSGATLSYTMSEIIGTNPVSPPQFGTGMGSGKVQFQDFHFARHTPFHNKLHDATFTVQSLVWSPRSNIACVEFTPVLPLGAPTEGVIRVADLDCDDMSDLVLTDASLSTFDATIRGEGRATLRERFQNGTTPSQDRIVLVVGGLESPDRDGVSVDAGPGATGAGFTELHKCCRGHVIIMKAFDDEGGQAARLSSTFDAPTGTGTLVPDFGTAGAAGVRARLHNDTGDVTGEIELVAGRSLAYSLGSQCFGSDVSWQARSVGGTTEIEVAWCSGIATLPTTTGTVISSIRRIVFSPIAPPAFTIPVQHFIARATFSDGSSMDVTSVIRTATPPSLSCSPADVSGGGADGTTPDGTVDGNDFIAFINSFGIGDASVDPVADIAGGGPLADQPDGTIDGNDFIAFINAFAIGC